MLDQASWSKGLGTLVIALLAAGCSGAGGRATPSPFEGDASEVLTLTIRNEQLDQARVIAWVSGHRRNLGDVRGNSTQTFQVPMRGTETVYLTFKLLLGATCRTREVILGPGSEVEFRIPSNLITMDAVCRRD
jgi:hypothetical protein